MTNDLNFKDELTVKAGKRALYLNGPNKTVRVGWRESTQVIASNGDEDLLGEAFQMLVMMISIGRVLF